MLSRRACEIVEVDLRRHVMLTRTFDLSHVLTSLTSNESINDNIIPILSI